MGFLNPAQDDDYHIASMPGTTDIPAPGALEGLATAVPKGLVSAGEKISSLATDIEKSDVGSYLIASATHVPQSMLQQGAADAQETARNSAAIKTVTDWAATGQDPRVTGSVGRIVNSTTEGVSIGLAGGAVAGPWGAATLLGSTYAHSTYLQAKAEGKDDETAKQLAIGAGLFSFGSAFVPMKFGNSLPGSLALGAGSNLALGAAQRGLTSDVLDANGYHDEAKQYRVFDGEAMAADGVLGLAFGAMGHFMPQHGAVSPADVDAATAVSAEEHFNRSAPGVPTDPQTATLHTQTMEDALKTMADGGMPDVPPEAAQRLVDNVLPDPIHETAQPLSEAAAEDIPHFDDAMADVKRVELPPEQEVPPKPEPPPAAAGEPAKTPDVPLDEFHGAMLDHMAHNYPDETYQTEDGREVTYKQMAAEMQKQRNEADTFAKLHDIAAACAARNG